MPVNTYEITHEKILKSGMELFLEKGYERTNLRELCKKAGVTTGAYYRHFETKEALFVALVEPAVQGIRQLYTESEEVSFNYLEEEKLDELFQLPEDTVCDFIRFIYRHFKSFKLVLQCADGTPYVTFLDDLVDLEVRNVKKMTEIMKDKGILVDSLSEDEYHMFNYAYFSCIFECVMHDYSEERALQYIGSLVKFFTSGWKAILGL